MSSWIAACLLMQSTAPEWFSSGLEHHLAARYDEAMHAFNRARELGYQPEFAPPFRIARTLARKNLPAAALDSLQQAADKGFSNLALLQNDADFTAVRTEPRWGRVLRQVDRNGKPCLTDERYRAFDFWIGDWAVTNFMTGAPAGENDVQASLDGCLMVENWLPANGNRGRGRSFNFLDATTGRWRQVYVSDAGNVLDFVGEIKEGGMHFSREYVRAGQRVRERMVFSPLAGGDVQQNWESSTDDGRTWQSLFNGRYSRKRAR